MKMNIEDLQKVQLFSGIKEEDLSELLQCLHIKTRSYKKNEFIYLAGDQIDKVGIVLLGSVQVLTEDSMGNRTILVELFKGEIFGEVFACLQTEKAPVSVLAVSKSEVLFVDIQKIITMCTSACEHHKKLIENLLLVLAGKTISLTQKVEHLSKRSTREKLLSYLNEQKQITQNKKFEIPFNRQQLADYLCVDRSAMSAELCRMQGEGKILFHKNQFEILE